MTDDENHAQVEVSVSREAVPSCHEAGGVHPQAVLLAAARVTGELGADAALASGEDLEEVPGVLVDVLVWVDVRHDTALRAEPPTMGNVRA